MPPGTEFTVTQANGVLKPVFGKLQNLLPETALLQKMFPLNSDNMVGDHFEEPVVVRMPHGHSFNGSGGGVVALNSPLAGKTEPAKVYPVEYVLRDQASYGLLDRAKNGGEAAFVSAASLEAKMMALSARNILEISALHGREGIGTVSGAIASHVITLTAGSYSPAILALLEGCRVDVFQSDLSTKRALNLIVSAVDIDAGTVTVIDLGMTGADANAEDDSGVTTNDVLLIGGVLTNGGTWNEQIGLGKQLSTVTGSLFDISKSTYSAWRAGIVNSVGEFSVAALVTRAMAVVNRGFSAGELLAIMSPQAWGVLDSSLSTNETFQGGYSARRVTGTDDIEVRANGIRITAMAHPFQKTGQVYLIPKEYVKRIGAVDLTFAKAGSTDEFLRDVPGYNAMERQCRAQWQIFLERPSYAARLNGITYSS